MVVVGYNINGPDGIPYWIIQNSFGTDWGIGGLAHVEMTNDLFGPCGMHLLAVAPMLAFKHVPSSIVPPSATSVWKLKGPWFHINDHACKYNSECSVALVYREESGVKDQCCQVSSVAASPDGTLVAIGAWDYTVRLRNIATNVEVAVLRAHADRVMAVAFSPDGTLLASGSSDFQITLWRVATREVVKTLVGHTVEVACLAFSPDGKLLASCGGDNVVDQRGFMMSVVRLWNVDTSPSSASAFGDAVAMLIGHAQRVLSFAFSPDGKTGVSGSQDAALRLWDMTTFTALGEPLRGHLNGVTSVAFSPDGRRVASGSYDYTVRLWDVQATIETAGAAEVPRSLEWLHGNLSAVNPAYTLIQFIHGERVAYINDTSHTKSVTSIAFSPDGATLVSGSYDSTVRMWDTATLQPVAVLSSTSTDAVTSVAFVNNDMLAFGGLDGYTRLYTRQDAKR